MDDSVLSQIGGEFNQRMAYRGTGIWRDINKRTWNIVSSIEQFFGSEKKENEEHFRNSKIVT